MKIIREGNKVYTYDPTTGLIVEAAVVEVTPAADVEASTMERALSVGARVEADGKLGVIVARTDSVYGEAFGVRFDDGTFNEYLDTEVKMSAEEKSYDSPVAEIKARFTSYNELPAVTEQEIITRTNEASELNKMARQIIANGKLQYVDEFDLDQIVTATASDLKDLEQMLLTARVANNPQYTRRQDRFEIAYEVNRSAVLGSKGDSSWLENAIDDMEVGVATDADMAVRATEVVARFDRDQLENNSFIDDAAMYHVSYLGLDEQSTEQFLEFVEAARQERLASLPLDDKTASVDDDDIDNFDTTALYL